MWQFMLKESGDILLWVIPRWNTLMCSCWGSLEDIILHYPTSTLPGMSPRPGFTSSFSLEIISLLNVLLETEMTKTQDVDSVKLQVKTSNIFWLCAEVLQMLDKDLSLNFSMLLLQLTPTHRYSIFLTLVHIHWLSSYWTVDLPTWTTGTDWAMLIQEPQKFLGYQETSALEFTTLELSYSRRRKLSNKLIIVTTCPQSVWLWYKKWNKYR